MIVIIHNNIKVTRVFDYKSKEEFQITNSELVSAFFEIAKQFKNTLIIWCNEYLKDHINYEEISGFFHHKLIMASFNVNESFYIDERIGYVESSPFIEVDRTVKYPTWLMSSCIGGLNSDVLSCYNRRNYKNDSFEYVLNSIAKRGISEGLFCYSFPILLNKPSEVLEVVKPSRFQLFKFIRQHYKGRWSLLTLFNSLVYEKRFLLFPFIASCFTSKNKYKPNFKNLISNTVTKENIDSSIDVIIPTIGRKQLLYDVLKDLSSQTLLPKNVILIEQNPDIGSKTELDYLKNESWPFNIKHNFK